MSQLAVIMRMTLLLAFFHSSTLLNGCDHINCRPKADVTNHQMSGKNKQHKSHKNNSLTINQPNSFSILFFYQDLQSIHGSVPLSGGTFKVQFGFLNSTRLINETVFTTNPLLRNQPNLF
jgi:hypothetical protein